MRFGAVVTLRPVGRCMFESNVQISTDYTGQVLRLSMMMPTLYMELLIIRLVHCITLSYNRLDMGFANYSLPFGSLRRWNVYLQE
jgi:hypothetical protein